MVIAHKTKAISVLAEIAFDILNVVPKAGIVN
jgi:hypothetical protein